MSNVFHIDPAWANAAPVRKRGRLIRDFFVTAALLTACWFIHIYLFWGVVVLACIFWLSEVLSLGVEEAQNFADEYRVELRDDGLFRYYRNTKGQPLSVLSPWKSLTLQKVRRGDGRVTWIRLIDRDLPRGARTIELEGLADMDSLLSEVEKRLGSRNSE